MNGILIKLFLQKLSVKTAENIKKVALALFLLLGTVHIISGLMFTNGYLMPTSMVINRVLDIPFAMMAVVYGCMVIYTGIDEKKRKGASIAMIVVSLLIFAILIYINLFIPDKATFIT